MQAIDKCLFYEPFPKLYKTFLVKHILELIINWLRDWFVFWKTGKIFLISSVEGISLK